MSVLTKVSFRHPDMAFADTIRQVPDLDLRVLPEVGTDPEHDRYYFQVESGNIDRIRGAMDDDHTVDPDYTTDKYGEKWVVGVKFTPETNLLAPVVTDVGGFVIEARTGRDGWIERYQFPDRKAVHALWEHARAESFRFNILELYRSDLPLFQGSPEITEPQREAILAAYENGYFKEPREISLDELAELLDISPSAVGGRLRRGIETLIESTVVEEPDEDGERRN